MPKDASKAPDWCNVVIYTAADQVYVIDSGGGTAMRASIDRVLNDVGVVDSFTLINTHGHLDHICNNAVISSVRAASAKPAYARRYCRGTDAPTSVSRRRSAARPLSYAKTDECQPFPSVGGRVLRRSSDHNEPAGDTCRA